MMATPGWEGYGVGTLVPSSEQVRAELGKRAGRQSGAPGERRIAAPAPAAPAVKDGRTEGQLASEDIEPLFRSLVEQGRLLWWFHCREPRGSRAGLPDYVLVVRPGLVLFIELKRPDGSTTTTTEQDQVLDGLAALACVARSLAEVIEFLKWWRV